MALPIRVSQLLLPPCRRRDVVLIHRKLAVTVVDVLKNRL
jgi:hypothetical protein